MAFSQWRAVVDIPLLQPERMSVVNLLSWIWLMYLPPLGILLALFNQVFVQLQGRGMGRFWGEWSEIIFDIGLE
jgi:hypothetical protein